MITENKPCFAFFPYLKTSESVHYRNLTIRSSDDLVDLPDDVVEHLKTIRNMFFLRDNLRIQRMSYVYYIPEGNKMCAVQFMQQLLEFQALICFIYSSPHPTDGHPFLNYEHSSFFLMWPIKFPQSLLIDENNAELLVNIEQFEIDKRGEIDGYEGQLNNTSHFWVTKQSQIFPPTTYMWLNNSQDLHTDFYYRSESFLGYQPVIGYFATRKDSNILGQRVLTSITWYNRTLKIGIEEEVAIVNLAIAFESLLDLDNREKVTERFKEAVGLLLGNFPRLDSWLTQFYKARSEIVHEGKSQNLMFIATDNPKSQKYGDELIYRSLVSYGRRIFQACVATILTGARISEKLDLSSMLVTNKQRFEQICQTLAKTNKTAGEVILAVSQHVNEIEKYRFVQEKEIKIEQMIGATKLLLKKFLETEPHIPSEMIAKIEEFAKIKSDRHYELLSLMREILSGLKNLPSVPAASPSTIRTTIVSLMESVDRYTFIYYIRLRKEQSAQ